VSKWLWPKSAGFYAGLYWAAVAALLASHAAGCAWGVAIHTPEGVSRIVVDTDR